MKASTSTNKLDTTRLDEALDALCAADPVTRPRKALAVLSLVPKVLRQEGGVAALLIRSSRFDTCGGFVGTPWDKPARLRPRLWAGSFDAGAPYPWTETMSTLRVLAVALGEAAHEDLDREGALRFLERILSLNMDKILEGGTEADRVRRAKHHKAAQTLLRFVLHKVPRLDFLHAVADEVEAIMAQRPVWTHHVRAAVRMVSEVPGADEAVTPSLDRYVEALLGPTETSMRFRDPEEYAAALTEEAVDVRAECEGMATSLRATGLACAQHAALVRHVADDPELLAQAMGLDDRGASVLRGHGDLVRRLVEEAIWPGMEQTIYGLARALERGLLDREDVVEGLERLMSIRVHEKLADAILRNVNGDVTAEQALLSGTLRVLGQPLGVGQGNNPTCNAARGISLWSQYRPGHLLEFLVAAARDDEITVLFDQHTLHSSELGGGLAQKLDPDLDPVSLALVPHLDRLYDRMMQLASGRGEDAHKWVNPALYGRIVPPGFSACFDALTWAVHDHGGFVRKFYATFHPDHNDGHPPVYAIPVGITVTDDRGRLLGLHAVTLQRVTDHDGWRIYFYNPNNEGRQDWGDGVAPSVQGHGELEGESSLPFEQFASRIYGFHHPIRLPGEPADVPAEVVERVTKMARRTWGRAYPWAR